MIKGTERFEQTLHLFDASTDPRLLARIEHLVWSSPLRIIAAFATWLLALLILVNTPILAKAIRLCRALIRHLDQLAAYGRPLTAPLLVRVNSLGRAGVSRHLIRDGVIGRVIRNDGSIDQPRLKHQILLLLGVCWHILTLLITGLLIALAVFLPMGWPAKTINVLLVMAFSFFASAFMNAISVRPKWASIALSAVHEKITGAAPEKLRSI